MELYLKRFFDTGKETVGALFFENEKKPFCFILEDEQRELKISGETRIPAGRYEIKPRKYGRFYQAYKKRWDHKYVFELKDVPNFTDILIHTGVHEGHTAGCLLTGGCLELDPQPQLRESRNSYNKLYLRLESYIDFNHKIFISIIDN